MAISLRHMRNLLQKNHLLQVSLFKPSFIRKQGGRKLIQECSLHTQSFRPSLLLRPVSRHGKHKSVCHAMVMRFKSTETFKGEELSDGYFMPPEGCIESEKIVDAVNSLGEPSLSSMGLGGSTPWGLIQSGLEMIHTSLDLPWWASIAVGVVIIRCCMLPIAIKSRKSIINISNHMPTIQKLQQRITDARIGGDEKEVMRLSQETQNYMKRNNIKLSHSLLMPLAQLPVFVSVFRGLKGMAGLPVESMKTGGLFWFTDLTVADPFFLLPVMTGMTTLLTIELTTGQSVNSRHEKMMKNFLRFMALFIIPCTAHFPAAMLCYWLSSNAFTFFQVMIMRNPKVQEFLNMPKEIKHDFPTIVRKVPFQQAYQDSLSNANLVQEMQDRQRFMKDSKRSLSQSTDSKHSISEKQQAISDKEKVNKT